MTTIICTGLVCFAGGVTFGMGLVAYIITKEIVDDPRN